MSWSAETEAARLRLHQHYAHHDAPLALVGARRRATRRLLRERQDRRAHRALHLEHLERRTLEAAFRGERSLQLNTAAWVEALGWYR